MEITITGTLDELTSYLINIKGVIDTRKLTGWQIGHPSEEWLYVTYPERGRVCPICQALEGRILAGDQIPVEFPYYEYLGELITLPHTHMPDISAFMNEPCHCEMHLQNLAESIEQRLHEEKMMVV